eukprot:1610910-Rhodomonas_salina.4
MSVVDAARSFRRAIGGGIPTRHLQLGAMRHARRQIASLTGPAWPRRVNMQSHLRTAYPTSLPDNACNMRDR